MQGIRSLPVDAKASVSCVGVSAVTNNGQLRLELNYILLLYLAAAEKLWRWRAMDGAKLKFTQPISKWWVMQRYQMTSNYLLGQLNSNSRIHE